MGDHFDIKYVDGHSIQWLSYGPKMLSSRRFVSSTYTYIVQAVTEHTVVATVLGSCECEKVCYQRIPLAKISLLGSNHLKVVTVFKQ